MSRFIKNHSLKPWMSIMAVLFSTFLMVFLQMESRRMGYVVWKQLRELKSAVDTERTLSMQYAKINRPERLQELAVNRLTLSEIKSHQVIHMSGERVAVR